MAAVAYGHDQLDRNLAAADAVVLYDPETPDGFHCVARTEADTAIIRMPASVTKQQPRR
ncbi:hypothetical protein AB0J83_23250 [Actinoplanes sp. NPDC049596]|uniref:hypothetical protein n=1 Tax=unclassified Actinoplanes TaxID=2626549 RepID=UPI00342A14EF